VLNILFTVDTEVFPLATRWKEDHLASDIKRDIYGEIDGRAVGLGYQLEMFKKHGLKASFMVESMFSAVPEVGIEPLKTIVRAIRAGGHDMQLHPHTEWIPYIPGFEVPYRSHLLHEYPLDEQEAIIRHAKRQFVKAGARAPVAFRAGGFAADSNTILALDRCGIKYDSSFNLSYLRNGICKLPEIKNLGHVTDWNGVKELPIAVFEDWPSHVRHAQLCAISTREMVHALETAERDGWEFFVIVSHSFEMLSRRRHPTKPPVVRQAVVNRFERLCKFLGENKDRFRTLGFSDLHSHINAKGKEKLIKGKLKNTAGRTFSQAMNKGKLKLF
jgi:peptidoglycan/xylan/chitin deacetylase (PgdA/CDA1 family)